MRWGQRTLHHLEQVSEFAQFTRVQVRNRPMNQLRREVSAHDSRLLRQRSHWFALPASFGKEPLTQQSRGKLHGGLVVFSIAGRLFDLAWPTEVATVVVEVIYRTDVFWEEEVQRPVKCHTNLFVPHGQLAQVNRPPQPPREEAREIETENTRHAHATTDRSQQPDSFE